MAWTFGLESSVWSEQLLTSLAYNWKHASRSMHDGFRCTWGPKQSTQNCWLCSSTSPSTLPPVYKFCANTPFYDMADSTDLCPVWNGQLVEPYTSSVCPSSAKELSITRSGLSLDRRLLDIASDCSHLRKLLVPCIRLIDFGQAY